MKQTFLTIVLTAVGTIMLAATPLEAEGQTETPAAMSYYYDQALQALEEGNIQQAVIDFTMGYAEDDEPELSLEQLRLIKQKYGDGIDIPLLDMLSRYHDLKYSVGKFIMVDSNGKYGALNAFTGEEYMPFAYDGISEIYSSNNRTYWTLEKNGKKGLFDTHSEKVTIPFEFDDFFQLGESYPRYGFIPPAQEPAAWKTEFIGAEKYGKSGVITMDNKLFYPVGGSIEDLYPPAEGDDPDDARVVTRTTNAMGDTIYCLRTLAGKTIIRPELNCSRINVWMTFIDLYRETPTAQFAWAKTDGTIMQDFMPEYPRHEGKYAALVDSRNKWTFYDLYDWQKLSTLGEFDDVMEFSMAVFAVKRGGKWALLDVENAEYKADYGFPVQPGDDELVHYLVDLLGTEVDASDIVEAHSIPVIMVDGQPTMPVEIKDDVIKVVLFKDAQTILFGTVGTDGKTKIRPEYYDFKWLTEGRALAVKQGEDQYIVIDSNGKKLRDTGWDKVDYVDFYNVLIVREKATKFYGIFEMDLSAIHPCKYSDDEVYQLLEALEPDEE